MGLDYTCTHRDYLYADCLLLQMWQKVKLMIKLKHGRPMRDGILMRLQIDRTAPGERSS